MESIPVGIPFGDPPTFSPGDFDAVNRIYFSAPTAVTISSNPAGLPIIVDGATLTSPQTFNWALNSQHTLNVPAGPTIGGKTYLFGRWNSDLNADLNPSRTITVTPGSGIDGFSRLLTLSYRVYGELYRAGSAQSDSGGPATLTGCAGGKHHYQPFSPDISRCRRAVLR